MRWCSLLFSIVPFRGPAMTNCAMLLLQWIRPFSTCHICGAEFKQSLRTRDHDYIVEALSSILHTDFVHGFDFQQLANLPNSSTFSGCKRGKIHLDDNLAHKGHRPTRSKSSSQVLLKTQNFDFLFLLLAENFGAGSFCCWHTLHVRCLQQWTRCAHRLEKPRCLWHPSVASCWGNFLGKPPNLETLLCSLSYLVGLRRLLWNKNTWI